MLLCSKQGNKLFLLLNDKEQLDIFTKNEKLKNACINELHDLGVSDDEIKKYLDIEKGKTK